MGRRTNERRPFSLVGQASELARLNLTATERFDRSFSFEASFHGSLLHKNHRAISTALVSRTRRHLDFAGIGEVLFDRPGDVAAGDRGLAVAEPLGRRRSRASRGRPGSA